MNRNSTPVLNPNGHYETPAEKLARAIAERGNVPVLKGEELSGLFDDLFDNDAERLAFADAILEARKPGKPQ